MIRLSHADDEPTKVVTTPSSEDEFIAILIALFLQEFLKFYKLIFLCSKLQRNLPYKTQ